MHLRQRLQRFEKLSWIWQPRGNMFRFVEMLGRVWKILCGEFLFAHFE